VRGGGRCSDHQRASATARGYTAEWATYARAWLQRFPLCGQRQDGQRSPVHSRCTRLGVPTPARVVDHITSIVRGGDVFNPANHQSLCVACNTRKS
jgi:5-methylcytosine-specific restriction endonuclease McrA